MVLRGRAWSAMGAVVLVGTVLAGCTSGGGAAGPPGRASAGTAGGAAPLLTEAQAKGVFDRYALEKAAAVEKGDTEAVAAVEGGRLLE